MQGELRAEAVACPPQYAPIHRPPQSGGSDWADSERELLPEPAWYLRWTPRRIAGAIMRPPGGPMPSITTMQTARIELPRACGALDIECASALAEDVAHRVREDLGLDLARDLPVVAAAAVFRCDGGEEPGALELAEMVRIKAARLARSLPVQPATILAARGWWSLRACFTGFSRRNERRTWRWRRSGWSCARLGTGSRS